MATGSVAVDVLVIGGGMAGTMAALGARAAGASACLVRRSPGATALSSGAIGAAPDTWAAPGATFGAHLCTMDAARRVAAERPGHPYAVVGAGLERLEEALAFAAGELPELLGPPEPRPLFLATPYGGVQTCALAQRSMRAGDLASARGPLAVIGLRGHLGFDARLVAGALARHADRGAPRAVAVEIDLFMTEEAAVARPHELARALEADGAAEHAGEEVRRALPARAAVALFPPVLGLSPRARVVERIAEAASVPVAETLSDVPSVPGLRLHAALEARILTSGVRVLSGELSDLGAPGSPAQVGEITVRAGAWVLATGRFVGGGIARRGRLEETLFGLPVWPPWDGWPGASLASRPAASLTVRERTAAQPLLAAGIRVDHRLRPLGVDGEPFHEALFAAGAVVGGHEAAADGTGLGVAILTGYLAGRAAAGVP